MTARDSQRSKLYEAERAAFKDFYTVEFTTEEAESYIGKVCRSAWWKHHSYAPTVPVIHFRGGSRNNATASSWRGLTLPPWARTKFVILHELAHLMAPHEERHGRMFAWSYLQLVRKYLGKEQHALLKAAFRECKVRHTLHRRSSGTIDRWDTKT